MRRAFLAVIPFLLACPVRTAIVDANARHAKMTEARAVCWDLPKQSIFDVAKKEVEDYRKYYIAKADVAAGVIETFPREVEVPPDTPAKRHQLIVTLVPEASCTKVLCTALVEYEFSKKRGFEPPEKEEHEYGIEYDCSLKIDAALRTLKAGTSGAAAP